MKMNWMKKTGRTLLAAALLAGMASFAMPTADAAKNIKDLSTPEEITAELQKEGGAVYPIGKPNTGYAKYFTGRSFLYPMESKFVNVANVTFEPGCINFWHKHHGSCQVLAGVSGKGYYQIWGEEPKELLPGQSVTIPEGVKHWHGAQNGSWFQHLSIFSGGCYYGVAGAGGQSGIRQVKVRLRHFLSKT